MKTCAIYAITNRVNGKIYIGQTRDLANRKSAHFAALRLNRHRNRHLQAAYNRHGAGSFAFSVLEILPSPGQLDNREMTHISLHRSTNPAHGYNAETGGRRNHNITLATRATMTRAQQIRRNREYSI
jgi:group I intron endonuclease